MYNSKSPNRILQINLWYRCSISIYPNQSWTVFPSTPSDVFFEYCLYCSNTLSSSSSAICSWRFFLYVLSEVHCWQLFWIYPHDTDLRRPGHVKFPLLLQVIDEIFCICLPDRSEFRDPFSIAWVSFRICGPPDSASYFPSIEKNVQVMWKGPIWMKTLSYADFSSACNCIATLAIARS